MCKECVFIVCSTFVSSYSMSISILLWFDYINICISYPYINFLSSAEAAKTQKPFDTRRQVADRFLNRPLLSFFVASGLYHQAPAERCAWIPTRPWEEEIGDLALNRAVLVWFVKKFISFLVACPRIQMLMLLVAQSALGQVWCYIRNRVLAAFICQIFWWNRPEGGTRDKQPISKHQLLDGWHRSGVVGLLVVWSTNTIFHKVLMGILLISRPKVTYNCVHHETWSLRYVIAMKKDSLLQGRR